MSQYPFVVELYEIGIAVQAKPCVFNSMNGIAFVTFFVGQV